MAPFAALRSWFARIEARSAYLPMDQTPRQVGDLNLPEPRIVG